MRDFISFPRSVSQGNDGNQINRGVRRTQTRVIASIEAPRFTSPSVVPQGARRATRRKLAGIYRRGAYSVLATVEAKGTCKGEDVFGEGVRLLDGRKVAPSIHFRPPHNVEPSLNVRSRGRR